MPNSQVDSPDFKEVSFKNLSPDHTIPLIIRPRSKAYSSAAALEKWIQENQGFLQEKLLEYGALLFRGFDTYKPLDFEKTALAIDAKLQNNYYGTSPRNNNTTYTFSASELPPHYPIMQHCEMSFLKSSPRRIFFFCETEPQVGGETPITDFRKVYQDLDPEIREIFQKKGITNIRNYYGPNSKNTAAISKKTWDDMFNTQDKQEVLKQCQEQGLSLIWQGNDRLTLINDQEAIKVHPQSGKKVWFNHVQVFHNAAAKFEYQHIQKRQSQMDRKVLSNFLNAMTWYKRQFTDTYDHEMHVTFGDGSEIPSDYIQHLQEVIWKNMVFLKWELGDIVALDNFAVAHGRMPFRGPRNIMVAWTDGLEEELSV